MVKSVIIRNHFRGCIAAERSRAHTKEGCLAAVLCFEPKPPNFKRLSSSFLEVLGLHLRG